MKLYKVLNPDGTCCHGGNGKWYLPQRGRPGKWMPKINGELNPCENGYHLCRSKDLLDWVGPAIFEAETRGDKLTCDNKIVVQQARLLRKVDTWNERTARLFACDCAARVLPLFETKHPDNDRPRRAIETARACALGKAPENELAAVWAAAWDAVWAPARDAAWAVARDAAWAAARAAERKWQLRRLQLYLRYGDRVKPWPLEGKEECK